MSKINRLKRALYIALHIVPLHRAYRQYQATIVVNAKLIYNRRRKNRDLDWAREYLTRRYLEKHNITFAQWLRKVEAHG